jgi:epoxyqueuosine reductase QueG
VAETVPKEEIRAEIVGFVARHGGERGTETRWRRPLAGFASAADPLFARFRSVVSPSHFMPGDLLPGARTVIAFFVPFEPGTARANLAGRLAAREWAMAYIETNALIAELGAHLAAMLESRGHGAAATPATHNFDERTLVSSWSHRHVAWAAGLGAFGLNNMLITAQGCCGRLGSVLTTLELEADPAPAAEACLHKRGFPCGACARRCVNEALFEDRFDRGRCHAICRENGENFRPLGKATVCGKCVVGLPCSFAIPLEKA